MAAAAYNDNCIRASQFSQVINNTTTTTTTTTITFDRYARIKLLSDHLQQILETQEKIKWGIQSEQMAIEMYRQWMNETTTTTDNNNINNNDNNNNDNNKEQSVIQKLDDNFETMYCSEKFGI